MMVRICCVTYDIDWSIRIIFYMPVQLLRGSK